MERERERESATRAWEGGRETRGVGIRDVGRARACVYDVSIRIDGARRSHKRKKEKTHLGSGGGQLGLGRAERRLGRRGLRLGRARRLLGALGVGGALGQRRVLGAQLGPGPVVGLLGGGLARAQPAQRVARLGARARELLSGVGGLLGGGLGAAVGAGAVGGAPGGGGGGGTDDGREHGAVAADAAGGGAGGGGEGGAGGGGRGSGGLLRLDGRRLAAGGGGVLARQEGLCVFGCCVIGARARAREVGDGEGGRGLCPTTTVRAGRRRRRAFVRRRPAPPPPAAVIPM